MNDTDQAPPAGTVVVPTEAPSTKTSTVAPSSPVPLAAANVDTRLMLTGSSSVSPGPVRSTSNVVFTCGAALPAASCASAWSVCAPSPNVAAVTDQSPFTSATAVSVCSLAVPASMTTVTVAPGSLVPATAGVESLVTAPSAGAVTASVGSVASTVTVTSAGVPALPKSSEATARIVRGPSAG